MGLPILNISRVAQGLVAKYNNVSLTSVEILHYNTGFQDDYSQGILARVNGVLKYHNVTATGLMTTSTSTYGYQVTATTFNPV